MLFPNELYRLRIDLECPESATLLRRDLALPAFMWDVVFRPLPAGHDIPFDIHSQKLAAEMRMERNEKLAVLSRLICDALHEMVSKRDPIKGKICW